MRGARNGPRRLSGSDDPGDQYLHAIVTDCAIGLIAPFPIDVNAALNGRQVVQTQRHMRHRYRAPDSSKLRIGVDVEVLEKHLDRLALAIDRAGKRGAMYLPIYERIEAKLEELRAKEARMERARQRLK
jgi:hypothetical protein